MHENLKIGKEGEEFAVEFLLANGYEILEKNWRFKKAEIDIIAKEYKSDTLVFVEVKTRSYIYYGEPSSFVDTKKKRFILDAASQYMKTIDYEWAIRFDIIGIVLESDKKPKISHYKDAFFQ